MTGGDATLSEYAVGFIADMRARHPAHLPLLVLSQGHSICRVSGSMSEEPELRSGPPWAMEEMILAEPGLVDPVLKAPVAGEAGALVRAAVAAGQPVVVDRVRHQRHAAQAGAELLRETLGAAGVVARDAFEASVDPQQGGVRVAVSHEAGTEATLGAVHAAASTGARTALITAVPARAPDGCLVIATPLRDISWCHTVGYLSPLLVFCAMCSQPDQVAQAAIADGLTRRSEMAARGTNPDLIRREQPAYRAAAQAAG